jgi:hypothetical protein
LPPKGKTLRVTGKLIFKPPPDVPHRFIRGKRSLPSSGPLKFNPGSLKETFFDKILFKSLSLNNLWDLNPSLKKGEIEGFALRSLREIAPASLFQRGEYYLRTKPKIR